MSEEKLPWVCPFCGGEMAVEVLGTTEDGSYIIRCANCDRDTLVRDVTGRVRVTVEVL